MTAENRSWKLKSYFSIYIIFKFIFQNLLIFQIFWNSVISKGSSSDLTHCGLGKMFIIYKRIPSRLPLLPSPDPVYSELHSNEFVLSL